MSLKWIVCRIAFPKSDSARRHCEEAMEELYEKGYILRMGRGMRWYVIRRLVELGVLKEEKVICSVGRYYRRAIVLNIDALRKMYEELQRIRPPPVYVDEC